MKTMFVTSVLLMSSLSINLGCILKADELRSPDKPTSAESGNNELPDNEIDLLIKQFRNGDLKSNTAARARLNQIASESSKRRSEVVGKLNQIASDFDSLGKTAEDWNYWEGSVDTLGSLKAIESIDLLISGLDRTNGFGDLDFLAYPAARAIRDIGTPALESLENAMVQPQKYNTPIRELIARLLGQIGGRSEVPFLKRVLSSEKDTSIQTQLKRTISTLNMKDAI